MDQALVDLLNKSAKIHIIEAYTGRHISYLTPPWINYDLDRIAEVRFRVSEMPEIFYETDHSRKMIKRLNLSLS